MLPIEYWIVSLQRFFPPLPQTDEVPLWKCTVCTVLFVLFVYTIVHIVPPARYTLQYLGQPGYSTHVFTHDGAPFKRALQNFGKEFAAKNSLLISAETRTQCTEQHTADLRAVAAIIWHATLRDSLRKRRLTSLEDYLKKCVHSGMRFPKNRQSGDWMTVKNNTDLKCHWKARGFLVNTRFHKSKNLVVFLEMQGGRGDRGMDTELMSSAFSKITQKLKPGFGEVNFLLNLELQVYS